MQSEHVQYYILNSCDMCPCQLNISMLYGKLLSCVLYRNIDLKLRNKQHGEMHCKIGVTCVYNGHRFCTLITRQSNPPISQFISLCNEFTSFWSIFLYNNHFFKSGKKIYEQPWGFCYAVVNGNCFLMLVMWYF